jgi:hypothetical protein
MVPFLGKGTSGAERGIKLALIGKLSDTLILPNAGLNPVLQSWNQGIIVRLQVPGRVSSISIIQTGPYL